MDDSATEGVGETMLGEIEECNLEEILISLRNSLSTGTTHQRQSRQPKKTHVHVLDDMAAYNFRETQSRQLLVTGRSIHFVHALASHVAGRLGQTLLVVDLEGRFDPTRLACRPEDMAHVHVQRPVPTCPPPRRVGHFVAAARDWMLYGMHGSAAREWWGTVVIGGPGGDVSCGWRGWLRVQRNGELGDDVLPLGVSAQEALALRGKKWHSLRQDSWVLVSEWASFHFDQDLVKQGA